MSETQLTTSALYSARPVVEVDRERHALVDELLLSLEMRESEGGLTSAELRFANTATHQGGGVDFAFEHSDTDLLPLGAELRILAGEAGDPMEIFRGRISAVEFILDDEGQPELCVQAEDALMWQRMTRATRLHEAGTLRDIVEGVVSESGATPVISGLDTQVDSQLQYNESNLAFLRRLLTDYDADVQVVADELHVSPRAEVQRGDLTLQMGSQLHRVRVCADLADQTGKVTLSGFDVAQGATVGVESSEGTDLGPGDGRASGAILSDVFGERAEHLGRRAVYDQAEAQALVDAAFARRSRRFVTVSGTAEGNPALRVGCRLTLTGIGPRFSNTYYVSSTCHRFDTDQGYQVDFEAESAFLGG